MLNKHHLSKFSHKLWNVNAVLTLETMPSAHGLNIITDSICSIQAEHCKTCKSLQSVTIKSNSLWSYYIKPAKSCLNLRSSLTAAVLPCEWGGQSNSCWKWDGKRRLIEWMCWKEFDTVSYWAMFQPGIWGE